MAQFMLQLYVDRFATIEDRLAFKKSPNSYPVDPVHDRFYPIVHLGYNPFFVAIRALDLRLADNVVEFTYKVATDTSDPFRPVYAPRTQSIAING